MQQPPMKSTKDENRSLSQFRNSRRNSFGAPFEGEPMVVNPGLNKVSRYTCVPETFKGIGFMDFWAPWSE